MSAATDYLAHVKATRAKFFPATPTPVVPRRLVRKATGIIIYAEPIGPSNRHIRRGGRLIYKSAIGPKYEEPAIAIPSLRLPEEDRQWVEEAYKRCLIDAPLVAPERVVAHVCEVLCDFSVSWAVVRSDSRLKAAAAARRHISFRLHTICGWSTPRIGRLINKDHSSVVTSVKRHFQLMALGLEGLE